MITSAREFAHNLKDKLRLNLTARPWNLHGANDTLYWLIPSGEWPAYRHPKLVFSSNSDYPRRLFSETGDLLSPNKMFVGFNIERGFGEKALVVDSGLRRRKQIKDNDWAWLAFAQPDTAERFARTLHRLSETEKTHVYAISSYVHDRESDVPPEYDAIVFSCEGNQIRAVADNQFPVRVLAEVEQTTSFVGLMDAMRAVDDYYWVDLYAGTYVETGDVDVLELYRNVLSYFEPWIGAAG